MLRRALKIRLEDSNHEQPSRIHKAMRSLLAILLLIPMAAMPAEEVTFESHGAKLAGSIVLPSDGKAHAAVVFVHGSGPQSRNRGLAEVFAREGLAALVYYMRGAGKSGGVYEANQNVSETNISLLADDAAAAADALATHPALAGVPVGIAGISQAGWIAPIAAGRSRHVKFLVLWSGPVCKVSEEDIFSKYTTDADMKAAPPWSEALAARKEPYIWPDFLGKDTDPAESLAGLTIPGLWIFSDNDGSIPVDLSISRLNTLRQGGHPYDYALFSGLGHDNIAATFATVADWIERRRVKP
jgi:pimeloyl-ACP methyl ester carboxylesterase